MRDRLESREGPLAIYEVLHSPQGTDVSPFSKVLPWLMCGNCRAEAVPVALGFSPSRLSLSFLYPGKREGARVAHRAPTGGMRLYRCGPPHK